MRERERERERERVSPKRGNTEIGWLGEEAQGKRRGERRGKRSAVVALHTVVYTELKDLVGEIAG